MSQMSFASQQSFFSQPRQLNESTPMSSSLLDDSESSTSSTPMKGWVNERFQKAIIDGKCKRVCRAEGCTKQYVATISTQVFKQHWKKCHDEKTNLKKTRFLFHDELHTNRIIKAVIDLHWDFSVVDKPAFRSMLQAFNSNKNIIGRKTLSRVIANSRSYLATKVSEKLGNALSVALTFDIWSVRKGARGFGCLTAHYINTNGELVNLILNFERMKFPHDGDTICKFIARTIKSHNLEGRVIGITTDNASNNLAAIRKLSSMNLTPVNLDFVHYKCVAHVIDLGIKDAMIDLKETVKPVREAVMAIRSSRKRKELFISKQSALIAAGKQSTNEPLELAEDVDHRWNSALILLERAFLLRTAIDQMLEGVKGLETLEKIDWPTLEIVVNFLKPFHDSTKRVCSGTEITIALVSVLVPRLVNHCVKFESSSNISIQAAARALRSKLTDYECELYNPIVNLAYVLHPKYKTKNLSDEMIKIVQSQLKKLLDETQVPLSDSTTSMEDFLFDQSDDDDDEEPFDELETYLRSRRERTASDAPIWWRNNAGQYPKMSNLARKILPLQATSVASERVFSVAGDVDTKTRNRLSDESVENIVIYKSWMQFLNIE